jgi:hypothetical protein
MAQDQQQLQVIGETDDRNPQLGQPEFEFIFTLSIEIRALN